MTTSAEIQFVDRTFERFDVNEFYAKVDVQYLKDKQMFEIKTVTNHGYKRIHRFMREQIRSIWYD